jgi:hypothetical protein
MAAFNHNHLLNFIICLSNLIFCKGVKSFFFPFKISILPSLGLCRPEWPHDSLSPSYATDYEPIFSHSKCICSIVNKLKDVVPSQCPDKIQLPASNVQQSVRQYVQFTSWCNRSTIFHCFDKILSYIHWCTKFNFYCQWLLNLKTNFVHIFISGCREGCGPRNDDVWLKIHPRTGHEGPEGE